MDDHGRIQHGTPDESHAPVALGVPATRIHEIVKERRAVTADIAARLANYVGSNAASWLVMQANHDLKTLPTLGDIQRHVPAREQLAA